MLNKRKAMIGWLVYTAAKPMAKRALKSKARGVVPGRREQAGGSSRAAILAGAGALAGAVMFWRSRSGGSDDRPES
jgi:hypothetical protein